MSLGEELTAICRKSFRHQECPRQDLNLYVITDTSS